jgi:hypothetical protein
LIVSSSKPSFVSKLRLHVDDRFTDCISRWLRRSDLKYARLRCPRFVGRLDQVIPVDPPKLSSPVAAEKDSLGCRLMIAHVRFLLLAGPQSAPLRHWARGRFISCRSQIAISSL